MWYISTQTADIKLKHHHIIIILCIIHDCGFDLPIFNVIAMVIYKL